MSRLQRDDAAASTELGYVFTFLLGVLLLTLYSVWAWDIENATRERWSIVAVDENINRVGQAVERADSVARMDSSATYSERVDLLNMENININIVMLLDEERLLVDHPSFERQFEQPISSAAGTTHSGEINLRGESTIWVHLSSGNVTISTEP